MISSDLKNEYDLLHAGAGFVLLPRRTLLRLSGADNRQFLHNFCTADVNSMKDGDLQEAFVLDSRGKILVFCHLLHIDSELYLTSASSENSQSLMQHLDKYIIREDVRLEDLSSDYSSIFIFAPRPTSIPDVDLPVNKSAAVNFANQPAVVAHGDFAGIGILVIVPNQSETIVLDYLRASSKLRDCSLEALAMIRLENGTPWYGNEIDDTNLPQEIQRDATAISFTKGCYLGQETVARIDAIGHVNKLLVGLQISGEQQPNDGAEIRLNESKVGQIASSEFSPRTWRLVGFGFHQA